MAQAISEQKLAEWMRKLGPRLINLSAAICRDRHHAEEIVQEAFVKLWQKPPTAGEVAWPAWLRRVVVNLSINVLQRTLLMMFELDESCPKDATILAANLKERKLQGAVDLGSPSGPSTLKPGDSVLDSHVRRDELN